MTKVRTTVRPSDSLIEQATSLRALLDQERASEEDLAVSLAQARDNITRLERAIKALTDEPVTSPTKDSPTPAPKKSGTATWMPKEERVTTVRAYVEEHFGPEDDITSRQIMDGCRMSNETARKCLDILRQREFVRLIRPGRPGASRAWRRMPHAA